jgi:hypothetical protein
MQAKRLRCRSKTDEVVDFAAAQEFHSNGWTEGLPVLLPAEAAVEACVN